MKDHLKDIIKAVSLRHLIFILGVIFAVVDFIITLSFECSAIRLILESPLKSAILIFLSVSVLFAVWAALFRCFKKERILALDYSSITLSPILLLFFWKPPGAWFSFLLPLIIILSTQICLFIILTRQDYLAKVNIPKQRMLIAAFIILYFVFFSYIITQKFHSFSSFNPKDFAIYNQTFWNTINGRPFQNSTYGSNFACHNTVFFFLLVPFYYIFPHPLTLSILKTLLLALSAIPFYLIARDILKDNSVIPLTLTYMLYPFLITQNFTPPHEICYLPLFALFTYYFFRQDRFSLFMIFLVLAVSIKEHLALLALIFGLYALFCKKSLRWALTPILLGIGWGIFSLAIIAHFQKIYQPHPDAAWFLPFLRRRFLSGEGSTLCSIISGLSYSNLFNWHNLKSMFLLFYPLVVIPPLLSPVSLLGLPELIINLLSDRSAMLSPLRHYNIIVSCFLLIGAAEGVKKICSFKWMKNLKIEANPLRLLISVFILSSALIHSYLWLGQAEYPRDAAYIKTVKMALSVIPGDAFVTVPENIAVHISNREKYSLIRDGKYGDYILIGKDSSHLLNRKDITDNYTPTFDEFGVSVLIHK